MTIDGLYNFRDVGGLPLQAGGTTRAGVLFRSAALDVVTPEGLEQFAATDIGVIVDFRTPQERESAPDRLPDARAFQTVELSILEGAMADMTKQFMGARDSVTPDVIAQAMSALPALGDLYLGMLKGGAQAFAEVAHRIAASDDDEPTAVLIHCTAGKDRTGVAAALMLDAVGTQRAAVVADYAVSQENLAGPWADGMIHMITSLGLPLTPELRTLVTGTPPEAIEQALAWVDAEFDGAAGYLQSGGLSDSDLAALRSRLAS